MYVCLYSEVFLKVLIKTNGLIYLNFPFRLLNKNVTD